MIRYDFPQCSPAWWAVRIGLPTASRFSEILTPKTRKPSASADKYALELCASWLLGEPVDSASSQFMDRGIELEEEARNWYSFTCDVEVDQVGFITEDAGRWGCSPDGLVGADGLVEFKCLSAVNHVAALLGSADEYVLQVQGQLWIAERSWADRVYYHPTIPPVVQRVERDDDLIAQLAQAVAEFSERLHVMKTQLLALGCKPKAK